MGSPVLVPIALALTRLRARVHRTAVVFAAHDPLLIEHAAVEIPVGR